MHLGGDEVRWIVLQSINECNASLRLTRHQVNTKCWSDTPSIAAWMTSKGFSADQSYEYFVQRAQGIAHSTIIHQWLPGSTVAKTCTSHGYRVLWSTDGVWYLDGLDTTWQTMYAQEPCTGIDPVICSKLVLGGGGEMWGETVDASDLISTVWPRAAAIAERLWSPQSITDIDAAAVTLPRVSPRSGVC
jgi:hexosaminidase